METGHFKTPGEIIREAREARGLSLDDLAAETRISERMLKALEADNHAQLNGPLYVRSFLRTCAGFLDLDPELLLHHYNLLRKELETEAGEDDDVWQRDETNVQRVGRPLRPVLWILLAVAAVVVAAVLLLRGGGTGTPDGAPAPAETRTTAADSVGRPGVPGDSVAAIPLGAGPAAGRPGTAPSQATGSDDARPEAERTAASPAAAGPRDRPSALPTGGPDLVFTDGRRWPLVLRLVFRSETTYALGRDRDPTPVRAAWPAEIPRGLPQDDIVAGRLYAIGSAYVVYWCARDHFLLRLDSADGVTATLNGRRLEIPGGSVGRDWLLDAALLGG